MISILVIIAVIALFLMYGQKIIDKFKTKTNTNLTFFNDSETMQVKPGPLSDEQCGAGEILRDSGCEPALVNPGQGVIYDYTEPDELAEGGGEEMDEMIFNDGLGDGEFPEFSSDDSSSSSGDESLDAAEEERLKMQEKLEAAELARDEALVEVERTRSDYEKIQQDLDKKQSDLSDKHDQYEKSQDDWADKQIVKAAYDKILEAEREQEIAEEEAALAAEAAKRAEENKKKKEKEKEKKKQNKKEKEKKKDKKKNKSKQKKKRTRPTKAQTYAMLRDR